MSRADHLEKLKKMLMQVSAGASLDQQGALESMQSRVESMEGVPTESQEVAREGIKRLNETPDLRDDTIDLGTQHLLEAIILPRERPAVLIVNDSFSQPPSPWQDLIADNFTNAIRAIGRVEVPNHPSTPYGGTGFIVGPNLIMTNRHVAQIFASGIGRHQLDFLPGRTSAIDFEREIVPTTPRPLTVTQVVMVHPFWDMALLRVEGLSDRHVLPLSVLSPQELENRKVVVVGYPARDWRSNIQLQNEIFGGMFEVKRLQPGHLRGVRTVDSFGNKVSALTHDASTLGGNSGSAIIDVETGHVVALHFAGIYLDANFCVPMHELARDPRIVDCGLNFQGTVTATDPWAAVWRLADPTHESPSAVSSLPTEPDSSTHSPTNSSATGQSPQQADPSVTEVSTSANSTTTAVGVTFNGVHVTVPLKISISLDVAGSVSTTPRVPDSRAPAQSSPLASALRQESITDADVIKAYDRFSSDSLAAPGFQWLTALSTGVAAHLAYEVSSVVTDALRNRFQFDECEFLENDATECFVAANEKTILLSLRGTAQPADWITDVKFFTKQTSYGTVHRGFYFAFQAVKSDLEQMIRSLRNNGQRLVITGHSLGGALAVIAAAEWQTTFPGITIHTFGQPRVGRANLLQFLDQHYASSYYRYVNDNDIVTRIPPWHGHTGILKYFGADGSLLQESIGSGAEPALEIFRPAAQSVDSLEAPPLTDSEFAALQAALRVANNPLAVPTTAETVGLEGLTDAFGNHKMNGYLRKILGQLA